MDLGQLREEIDTIDREIIRLFEARIKVAENVARYKIETGKPVFDPVREDSKIRAARAMTTTSFNAEGIEAIFRQMMAISRMRQYEMIAENEQQNFGFEMIPGIETKDRKVAYQGAPGAYGHQAAVGFFGESADIHSEKTFEDVMKAVQDGEADFGVLPIENTSTGVITDVIDQFFTYDNCIVGEYVVRVQHALLGLPEADTDDVKVVYSHPQGLMQCSGFLSGHPDWEQISLLNTAVSAKKVFDEQDPSQAAIASELAAKYYQLKVLAPKINDNDNNSTRFIIICKAKQYEKKANGVSISFELTHESGTLFHILGFIIYNSLNMTKIESRPIRGEKWKYRFFIDLDGSLSEPRVRDTLKCIEKETTGFKILGNYVKAE